MTGILSLVMCDDIIRDSSILDISPSSMNELPESSLCDSFYMPSQNLPPRCSLSCFPQGYIQSKYTGYVYHYLPLCPAENYEEYQYFCMNTYLLILH